MVQALAAGNLPRLRGRGTGEAGGKGAGRLRDLSQNADLVCPFTNLVGTKTEDPDALSFKPLCPVSIINLLFLMRDAVDLNARLRRRAIEIEDI